MEFLSRLLILEVEPELLAMLLTQAWQAQVAIS